MPTPTKITAPNRPDRMAKPRPSSAAISRKPFLKRFLRVLATAAGHRPRGQMHGRPDELRADQRAGFPEPSAGAFGHVEGTLLPGGISPPLRPRRNFRAARFAASDRA